ncbi:hypothetical protein [Tessaracoccus antarcticus]|uniref:Uncharacterized protein n=1 Tax=Tessaracoccus antarcticus TaxID=2479848 RepID=A0A3M0GAM4_9ACTN|nr:hypothetical protein [Tessaracoccus antarcticus]RMB61347.1 hypothetical protein EAX62_01405 [Tessaracoccus antarcticus]
MMKHTRSASAVAALLAVLLLLLVPSTAAAQTRAAARSAVAVTAAGSWGAVAAPVGGAPVAGRSFTASTSAFVGLSQDFDVVNLGTLPLVGHTFQIRTDPGFAGPRNPTLTVVLCPTGAWKAGRCAGGEVSLGTNTSGNFTSTVPLAPGGRYSVNVSTPWYWGAFTSTVNVSVARDHVRAATLTNN